MQYFGGKVRIAVELAKFLDNELKKDQVFVDLFAGSMNVVSRITKTKNKIANDSNKALIATYKAAVEGFEFPNRVSEEDYNHAKTLSPENPLHGFILIGCSFAGKYKGGYARNKRGDNYARQAKNSIAKKAKGLKTTELLSLDYKELKLPEGALIYCDIPYLNTTSYKDQVFDHDDFYNWLFSQPKNNSYYISEYSHNNIHGLEVAWKKESKKSLRASNGVRQSTYEILMHYGS